MTRPLEEIRILPAADLLDEDKKTLKDNWNDLTPEEQDAFDSTINPSDTTPIEGETPEGDDPEGDKPIFKTQEEVDDYINKKLAEKAPEPDKPPEGDEPEIEVPDIFEKDEKPADWNEAFRTFVKKGGKVITEMTKASLQKEQAVLRKELEKVNKQIDADIDALAKDGKEIPKLGTPERTELNKELGTIATDYHMDNAPAAKIYEIYEMNQNKDPTGEPRRRNLAQNVSGGGNATGGGKTAPTYKDIKGKSMDQLIEESVG